jgi:hypothetical protein
VVVSEVVKAGLIADADLFAKLETEAGSEFFPASLLTYVLPAVPLRQ